MTKPSPLGPSAQDIDPTVPCPPGARPSDARQLSRVPTHSRRMIGLGAGRELQDRAQGADPLIARVSSTRRGAAPGRQEQLAEPAEDGDQQTAEEGRSEAVDVEMAGEGGRDRQQGGVHDEQEQAEGQDDQRQAQKLEQRAQNHVDDGIDDRDPEQPQESPVVVDARNDPRHEPDHHGQRHQANSQTSQHPRIEAPTADGRAHPCRMIVRNAGSPGSRASRARRSGGRANADSGDPGVESRLALAAVLLRWSTVRRQSRDLGERSAVPEPA